MKTGDAHTTRPTHDCLVVGDQTKVMRFLGKGLSRLPLKLRFAENGEIALETVRNTDTPFPLILSDQRLTYMTGTEFLRQIMTLSPDSVRLLITRYSDIEVIKASVNQGVVHRYLMKTGQDDGITEELRMAVNQYEMQQDTVADLVKAKSVGRQLYQLDQELIDSKKTLDQAHKEIDTEIARLQEEIRAVSAGSPMTEEQLTEFTVSQLGGREGVTGEAFSRIYSDAVIEVFSRFREIAKRKGVKMPKPGEPESHDSD
ncbi:MAG TPA: hypothetical protein DHV36_15140 [Desulfobacteraceae bacterium]|nr:hypothetical protein [Desulfobacteraceae bacterium]